nr:hypothetical protein Iba_chr11eCG4510 [Ipomoea batatas]
MAVLGKRIQDLMKNKFERHGGAGVPKGHVIVYVGEEEKEYYVSSKVWDAMESLRECEEQSLRCLPYVSPQQFEIYLNHAKLVVKKRVKPNVPQVGLIEDPKPKQIPKHKVFNLSTFTQSSTFLTRL